MIYWWNRRWKWSLAVHRRFGLSFFPRVPHKCDTNIKAGLGMVQAHRIFCTAMHGYGTGMWFKDRLVWLCGVRVFGDLVQVWRLPKAGPAIALSGLCTFCSRLGRERHRTAPATKPTRTATNQFNIQRSRIQSKVQGTRLATHLNGSHGQGHYGDKVQTVVEPTLHLSETSWREPHGNLVRRPAIFESPTVGASVWSIKPSQAGENAVTHQPYVWKMASSRSAAHRNYWARHKCYTSPHS